MKNIKYLADNILKQAADPIVKPEKHILTLEFDKNSVKKIIQEIGKIEGFSGSAAAQVQFQIPITINPSNTSIADFEASLKDMLIRKSFSMIKFRNMPTGSSIQQMKPSR